MLRLTDAYVIDGDHNYYTVTEELRLIVEPRASDRCHCSCSTTSAGPTPAATTTSPLS